MLEHLNHPFLCNLRYSFQDIEYLWVNGFSDRSSKVICAYGLIGLTEEAAISSLI